MRRFISCLAATLAFMSVSFVWRSEELPSYAKLLMGGAIPANADVAITEANFPDDTFRAYVSSNFDTDEDGVLGDEEIEAATQIDVPGAYYAKGNISSLKGIEYFTALTSLTCEYNELTTLDLSNNTALTSLRCEGNQLTALDLSNNTALTSLYCGGNRLTALDVSKNTALTDLSCQSNQLTTLDLSNNTALTDLWCGFNQLTALDVSKHSNLTTLECAGNYLTQLDVSNLQALTRLHCDGNQLTELDVSKNLLLEYFGSSSNQLTTLDVSKNKVLTNLYCDRNQLTELDVSNNTALEWLHCYGNQLTTLDVSNNIALESLDCYINQLTALDLSNNTALTYLDCRYNRLTTLDVSNNIALESLYCHSNQLTGLDVSNNTALEWLSCSGNQLTALDLSGCTALMGLVCYDNQLTALDVSGCTALTGLWCYDNQLTALDVSNNTALTRLDCYVNQLTELDLSNNTALTSLSCYSQTVYGLQITSSDNSSYPYQLSFSDYMSPDKFPNISDVKGKAANTDISTVYSEGIAQFASKPAKVTYNYATGYGTQSMDVTIRAASEAVTINAENFPDDTFREYVSSNFDTDGNGTLSDTEIEAATWIYVAGTSDSKGNISSLKGIEYFTALTTLWCHSNQLTELDLSSNTALTYLVCDGNQLTALDVSSNTALTYLVCADNQLTELDLSNNTALTYLGCAYNQLTKLDVSKNTALTALDCYSNQLTELDVSKNTALTSLSCHSNQLTELDLSKNTALIQLWCHSNQLTALDVSKNTALTSLYCGSNQLTTLNVSGCTALTTLSCANNQLTTLDVRSCPDVEITCDEGVTIIRSDNAKPEILTDSLPGGITGTAYSVQLQASGTTPITWTKSGTFPKGLSFSTSGLISGTPIKAGTFNITFTAKNAYGKASKKLKLIVIEPVSVTTASLKAGTIGKSYSVTLKAKGTKTITWSAEGLPDGMSINAKTGKISGKPTAHGKFSVKITAENPAGSVTKTLQLEIKAIAPTLSGSLKKPTLNVEYSSGLKVKGTEPITWILNGTLPGGLSFNTSTGVISGIPTSYDKSGYKITITASNDAGKKSKKITLKVNGKAPTITAKIPAVTRGEEYSATLTAKGSDPITFEVEGLPDGLSLNDGVISGTVTTTAKSFKITVYATNPVKTVKKNYTVKINAPKSAKETPSENTESESGNETHSNSNADNSTAEQNVTGNTGNQTGTHTQGNHSQAEKQKSGVPEGYTVVAELGEVSRDEAGMYDFEVELPDYVSEGAELMYVANSDTPSDDDEILEFFDSTGNEITAVPKDRKISISVWLNPDTIYHPAIAVKK